MFEMTLQSGKVITASAKRNDKQAKWTPSGNGYTVTIKTPSCQRSFDFWDSFQNRQDGKDCDIRGALFCFASDAFAGMNAQDSADIMSEFGYDDPKEARRVFAGVKKAEKQAKELGLTEEELQELADY